MNNTEIGKSINNGIDNVAEAIKDGVDWVDDKLSYLGKNISNFFGGGSK